MQFLVFAVNFELVLDIDFCEFRLIGCDVYRNELIVSHPFSKGLPYFIPVPKMFSTVRIRYN